MTLEIFQKLLAQDEYLMIDISQQMFSKSESLIRDRAYVSKEFLMTSY